MSTERTNPRTVTGSNPLITKRRRVAVDGRGILLRFLTSLLAALVLLLQLTVMGASPANAAALLISGHVRDSVTLQPIKDVCVTVGPPIRCWLGFGTNPGLHTDAAGAFQV